MAFYPPQVAQVAQVAHPKRCNKNQGGGIGVLVAKNNYGMGFMRHLRH
jgi:hypothetical protein